MIMNDTYISLRKQRNISIFEASRLLDISVEDYRLKESGLINFDLDEADKLSSYLGLPITVVFIEYFF